MNRRRVARAVLIMLKGMLLGELEVKRIRLTVQGAVTSQTKYAGACAFGSPGFSVLNQEVTGLSSHCASTGMHGSAGGDD